MEKPLIIYARDQAEGESHCDKLQRHFPTAEFVYAESGPQCIELIKKYADRLAMLVTDDYMPNRGEGTRIAQSLRAGSFGERLKSIPVAVVSGDPHYVDMHPPVIFMTSKMGSRPEGVQALVQRFVFSDDWKEQLEIFTRQDSRDHGARTLLGYFPKKKRAEDGLGIIEQKLMDAFVAKEIDWNAYRVGLRALEQKWQHDTHGMSAHVQHGSETHSFFAERYEQMKCCVKAAFEGGGAPSYTKDKDGNPGLLVQLIEAVARDRTHVPDDAYAVRYKQLLDDIMLKSRHALPGKVRRDMGMS